MSVSHSSALPPIRVDVRGDLPLYLQIKYQLAYLITTEKLLPGAKLPPVRQLAEGLDINVHTVAQAYRELQQDGLIDATVGRGSFVKHLVDTDKVQSIRQERLNEVLLEALRKARSLGFPASEVAQRLASMAQHHDLPCEVAYVDRSLVVATKYARSVERHLGNAVVAHPLSLDSVLSGDPEAARVVGEAFYVITVARNVPALEQRLPSFASGHQLLTIVAEVLPVTCQALAALDSAQKVLLFTEDAYLYSTLGIISQFSAIDPTSVEAFTPDSVERFMVAAKSADVVLYTYGAGFVLRGLGLERAGIRAKLVELAFDIGNDSVAKLRSVFGAA